MIAFISIFIGGFVTGTIQPLNNLIMACFSGMLIGAGANVMNDFFDMEVDRINKPWRPLPAGLIPPRSAFHYAIVLFAGGIVLSFFIHETAVWVASSSSVLLFYYSYRGKRILLGKNIIVAVVVGAAFLYGGMAVGRLLEASIVGIFALFYHLAREILKDIEDREGDRQHGILTLPVKFGIDAARFAVSVTVLVLILIMFIPYILHIFTWRYMLIIIVGVDFFLIYCVYSIWKRPDDENLARLSRLMKIDMLIALFAIYVGR
jgi:geranylgeranylglycerol-phosphate geranylgeranyltransferase